MGLVILPTVAVLLPAMATVSGIIVLLRTAHLHKRALRARLGNQVFCRRLRDNPRLNYRFYSRHRPYLFGVLVLVMYCIIVAVSSFHY
jgi:hypothetical protein